MSQVTTIFKDGSMVETTPMSTQKARKLYNFLKSQKTSNMYVLHSIN